MMQHIRDLFVSGNAINDWLPHAWIVDGIVINKNMSTSMGVSVE